MSRGRYIRFLATSMQPVVNMHSHASLKVLGAEKTQDDEEKGWTYDIVIMKFGEFQNAAGESGYKYVFPKEAAEASLEVFNGAKVYSNSEGDRAGHKSDPNTKVPKDIIGVITDVRVTETELLGKLNLYRGTGAAIRQNLLGAFKDSIPVPYELSIDAFGPSDEDVLNKTVTATAYVRVSVDLVERGAAGGQIVRMAASHITTQGGDAMSPTKKGILLLFSMLFPAVLEAKNVDYLKVDENELFTHLLEANKAQPRMNLPDDIQLSEQVVNEQVRLMRERVARSDDDVFKERLAAHDKKFLESIPAPTPAAPAQQPAQAAKVDIANDPAMKAMEARVLQAEQRFCESLLNNKLSENPKLPVPLQDDIRVRFTDASGKVKIFQESELTAAIDNTRKTWAKMQGGKVDNMGLDVRPGKDEFDKIKAGLEGFFLVNSNHPMTAQEAKKETGIDPYRSFRTAYVDLTGDKDVTGEKRKSVRFLESLITTDLGEVVASVMNKAMVRDYGMMGLDQWRQIVDVVPVTDFKTQRRIRMGGYGNLPVVAQRGTYLPLSSPTDEEATYVPTKKGGTEDLTLELIKNDDVGAIGKIPQKLARAAAQTLHEFIFDLIKPVLTTESVGSPVTIYDGTALYTTAHANKFTAALVSDGTNAAFNAARQALLKFSDKDNSKRLGIRAGFLITPSDLDAVNYALTMPAAGNSNLIPTFAQSLGIKPIVVPYWTDATDWVMAAKREDVVGIEIGFLDGKEDPELFVSDVENAGAWFTNDTKTFKIRHIYGGAVKDFRAFVGSVVSG